MLKNKFKTLCQNFTYNVNIIEVLWEEIEKSHNNQDRYYHTLTHLAYIYNVLPKPNKVMEFAIFYHDIIYNPLSNDNEMQSAILCSKRLKLLKVPNKTIDAIHQLIIETKTHEPTSEQNALFLDADLAILGTKTQTYTQYCQNVRQEYAMYNNTTYIIGRQKVLKHFLAKDKIYKSKYFHDKYEKQARENILIEYNSYI
ncbi:MAG: Unknown protein [uncultured Sulfurovum sp.]|uniref:Metal-dependent HD superfamily phosphohydrolase n=1 Tax=uncultured Sulfurovum sp. TaxID=269237 RepID=A0A6S6TWA7_9BACT|nr:MAG: Unknown protein [uncultured Sulfurovum sp.]